MGRSPCCDESGLKKGPWTPEEDEKLSKHIQKHGHGSWRALPKLAGLNRCGKSCRLRWTNYLRPDIKRGKFSQEEEQTILNLHSILGNKWSTIATNLPGRTDNEIKNFWNTHLKKKLIQMGFDPMTHRPRTDIFSTLPHLIALANLKEIMDQHSWEEQAARLQTEAAQLAKLQYLQLLLQPNININSPNFTNSHGITDVQAYNSLSSINKDNINNNIPIPNTSISMPDLEIPFSHMPDLEIPCSFPSTPSKDLMLQLSDFSSSSASPPLPLPIAAPLVTEISRTNNTGDACSTSSYGGGPTTSYWSALFLEDPLFSSINWIININYTCI